MTKQFLRILEQIPKAGFKFLRRVVDAPEAVIGAVHEMNGQQRIIEATANFIEKRLAFVVEARNVVKFKTNVNADFVLVRFLQFFDVVEIIVHLIKEQRRRIIGHRITYIYITKACRQRRMFGNAVIRKP